MERDDVGFTFSKKYRIDGEPVSARQLIKAAEALDEDFANDWMKQTSVAAHILRDNGHVVDDNPQTIE